MISCDVITIGNLSRNRYWGEGEEKPRRQARCTSTLVAVDGSRLLVDPSLADAGEMASELDRRAGIGPGDVDAIFVTHAHGDHHAGLKHFPEAHWLAAPDVAATINASGSYRKKLEPVVGTIWDVVEVIPTPGHTVNHHSLRFECDGMSIVVAGDAVMTRDFWRERRGYFNSVDSQLAAETMDMIARVADIVVPGHDNLVLNCAPRPGGSESRPLITKSPR